MNKFIFDVEFETAMSCHIEQAVVEVHFTQGEEAFCYEYE